MYVILGYFCLLNLDAMNYHGYQIAGGFKTILEAR